MDNNERKIFWDKLCSLKDGSGSIADVIKYPRYLYRYRNLTSKSLDDLKNNKLTFSTSNYYDDPFDTFLRINRQKLEQDINEIFKQNNNDFAKKLNSISNSIGKEISKEEISNRIEGLSPEVFYQTVLRLMKETSRNLLRSYSLSVCFSEDGLNESLWMKYANQHKGFAIIYDPRDESKFLCGKQDKCANCSLSQCDFGLYPVYYSDKLYDATEYAKWFTASLALKEIVPDSIYNKIVLSMFPKMNWEREKVTLIKKKCHMYDKEWRMIYPILDNKPITIEWKPNGVVLGLNMSLEDKDLVYHNAKLGRIDNIFECYIDENDELNYRKYRD